MDFKDCEFRFIDDDGSLHCRNKQEIEFDTVCDNCTENVHLNCTNFNPKKDLCLKFFREGVSELKECQEKTVFSDSSLQKKWSN